MLAVELDKAAVKAFMGQLLREEIFDQFEVRTIDIATNIRINIECQTEEGFSTWADLRPVVTAIIKTSPKPSHVKIVFSYKAAEACEIHENAAALFLNLAYENDGVAFTTGTSQKQFLMEKSLDTNWDEWVKGFFAKGDIVVTNRE